MRWKGPAAIVLLAVGAGAVVLAVTGGPGGSRASGAQYLTATATTGDIADTVVATGNLSRATTYDLNFGVPPAVEDASGSGGSGNGTWSVLTVKTAVGDVVKKGAVLATADTADLRRQLSSARNSLAAAKSQRTIAKENLDATTTTDTRRQARIAYDQAASQYTTAVGQVADLNEQIARATIVAPADGTVVTVSAAAGTDLSTGPAISVASGPLQAVADFTETDLPSLKVGQPASVSVQAIGASIGGKVVAIAPSATSSSGGSSVVTYPVTIDLTSPPATAWPGMSAQASVTIASASNVVTIPSIALNGSALGYTVLVLDPNGSAQSRDVTVGLVTSTQAEIQSGLQPGEAVVTGTTASQTTTTTGGGGFGLPGGGFQRGTNGGGTRSGGGGGGGGTLP